MKRIVFFAFMICFGVAATPVVTTRPANPSTKPTGAGATTVPVPPGWGKPSEQLIKLTEEKHKVIVETKPDVIFIGDSITEYWDKQGQQVWKKTFMPLKAANYGIGGDMVQQTLWRIINYSWEGVAPKVIVLLIGANNGDRGEQLFQGQRNLIMVLHKTFPDAKIIFMPVFPSNIKFKQKTHLFQTNKRAPQLAKEFSFVHILDITDKLLDSKGEVAAENFSDGQHLTEKGYQIWADALVPVIKPMLK